MGEKRYMISDAAKKVDVEPHVLRYWEEEIGIEIPRNEMGHRYYRKEDIFKLRSVRDLKEKGFQLKAIKLLLPDLERIESLDSERLIDLKNRLDLALAQEEESEEMLEGRLSSLTCEEAHSCIRNSLPDHPPASGVPSSSGEKLSQFRLIMNDIVTTAVETNNRKLIEEMNQCLTASVTREIDILLRLKEEREEERFRSFDRTIRERQSSLGQAAASKEKKRKNYNRRDSKFFRKHNVHI